MAEMTSNPAPAIDKAQPATCWPHKPQKTLSGEQSHLPMIWSKMLFILAEATYLQTWYGNLLIIHSNREHPHVPYSWLWTMILYLHLRCSQNFKMKPCCKGLEQNGLENSLRAASSSLHPAAHRSRVWGGGADCLRPQDIYACTSVGKLSKNP